MYMYKKKKSVVLWVVKDLYVVQKEEISSKWIKVWRPYEKWVEKMNNLRMDEKFSNHIYGGTETSVESKVVYLN